MAGARVLVGLTTATTSATDGAAGDRSETAPTGDFSTPRRIGAWGRAVFARDVSSCGCDLPARRCCDAHVVGDDAVGSPKGWPTGAKNASPFGPSWASTTWSLEIRCLAGGGRAAGWARWLCDVGTWVGGESAEEEFMPWSCSHSCPGFPSSQRDRIDHGSDRGVLPLGYHANLLI